MFSFSPRWLWAQCIAVGAAFLLLNHMALPGPGERTLVVGSVEEISIVSRKSLGSFHELVVRTEEGGTDTVLFPYHVAPSEQVRTLVGAHISAHVTTSSKAIDLTAEIDPGFDTDLVRRSNEALAARYLAVALFFAGAGAAIGLLTLAFTPKDSV
jgi:hypothetical protein